MAKLLTSLAKRAIGARPVAMPLVRPVFAAPLKLEPRELGQRELGQRDLDRSPMTDMTRPATSLAERAAPTAFTRNHEERNSVRVQQGSASPSAPIAEGSTVAETLPRSENAPSARPTLKEVIERIYAPREAPAGAKTAMPSASLLSERQRQEERADAMKEDTREDSRGSVIIGSRIERALPPTAEPQRFRELEGRFSRPAAASLPQPTVMRAETQAPANEVRVSIGRIELKAAPQPAAPMPQRTATQRQAHLSMSEYLEGKRGGRR
jgi:hypothetical protein